MVKNINQLNGSDKAKNKNYMMKEALPTECGGTSETFSERKIAEKIAYNEHRLIDVTKEFSDLSEKDVEYASGASGMQMTKPLWMGMCNYITGALLMRMVPNWGKQFHLQRKLLLERSRRRSGTQR